MLHAANVIPEDPRSLALPPRLLSGTVVSTVGRVLGTAISIGTIALVTRSLIAHEGPAEGLSAYGAYATVLAYITIIGVVADGGLYVVFTREAAQDDAREAALLEAVWQLRVATILLAAVIAVSISFLLPYSRIVRLGIGIGLFGMACQLVSQLFLGIFQKRLRLATPALAEVVGRTVQFLLAVWAAVTQGGILAFLGAFVGGTAVTCVWNVLGARRFVPFRLQLFSRRTPPRELRRLLREAWPLGLSLIMSVIFFKIDAVMLSILRPPTDIALYALPYKVLESLLVFLAMVGGMLLPTFSKAVSTASRDVATPLQSAFQLYLLFALPCTALLYTLAPRIIDLLGGPAFAASVPVLRILAVTLGLLFFGNLFGTAAIALREQRRLLWMYVLLTITNVGANLIAIPRYSYIGAAWTTLGTELLSVVLAGLIVYRHGVRLHGTATSARILTAGALLIVLLALPLPGLLPVVIAMGGYALTLLWLRAFTPGDLRRLLALQRSPIPSGGVGGERGGNGPADAGTLFISP